MIKLPARSRADLLASLVTGGLNEATAELLGFVRERVEVSDATQPLRSGRDTPPGSATLPLEAEETFPDSKPGQRLLRFLVPIETETWLDGTVPPKVNPGRPITDRELSVPWDRPGPPLSPLVQWARLAPYLRGRLGAWIPGVRLDEPRLMPQMARGLPLLSLPRRRRRSWAAQAVILWDRTPEMHPFQEDARWLLRRLRRERGSHGLAVVRVEGMPGPALLAGIPQDTPVVALSAMGQFHGAEATVQAWLGLGRHLAFAGHGFHALVPCPRRRWRSDLAETWAAAVWDRQPRLPRRGGHRALPGAASKEPPLAQHLLDLLSPSSRVHAPLLRDARLMLGPAADTGTEWDAWFDPGGWQSLDCFGFLPGEPYEARLARRRRHAETDPEQVRAMNRLIERHHESCSPVIAAEASLRACLAGTPDVATLERVQDVLGRVVDRMREMARRPGSAAGRRSGLATWFENMVERLAPDMRSDPSVKAAIAQGLALAKVFNETPHTVWPEGVDVEIARAEMQRAGQALEAPVDCRLVLRGAELFVELGGASDAGIPLARFRAGRRPVHFTEASSGSGPGRVTTLQLAGTAEPVHVGSVASSAGWRLQSDRQRIDLVPMARPAWARRMAYDRFGLWAEFEVGGVMFVMRWIPPGHFRMGSPEDESGRYPEEGPQHDVTISQGFWLGETPVTQAQWKAVVMEARKERPLFARLGLIDGLSPAPSHFKGPSDLPVESVSFKDATEFCHRVNRLLQPQLPSSGIIVGRDRAFRRRTGCGGGSFRSS